MAQIWIRGKLVIPSSDDELLRLLPYADQAPPPPAKGDGDVARGAVHVTDATRAQVTEPPDAKPFFAGVFVKLEDKAKQLLYLLAKSHPKAISREVIIEQLHLTPKDISGILVSFARNYGKGHVVIVISERQKNKDQRSYAYKLSSAVAKVAAFEAWKIEMPLVGAA